MKRCFNCHEDRPVEAFSKCAARPDGRSGRCKECANAACKEWRDRPENKNRQREANRVWKKNNYLRRSEHLTRSRLKQVYGITIEQRQQMWDSQLGKCAICGDPLLSISKAHIDHKHGTAPVLVRGLLCGPCNWGLGSFKDAPERLLNAVSYLQKFGG